LEDCSVTQKAERVEQENAREQAGRKLAPIAYGRQHMTKGCFCNQEAWKAQRQIRSLWRKLCRYDPKHNHDRSTQVEGGPITPQPGRVAGPTLPIENVLFEDVESVGCRCEPTKLVQSDQALESFR